MQNKHQTSKNSAAIKRDTQEADTELTMGAKLKVLGRSMNLGIGIIMEEMKVNGLMLYGPHLQEEQDVINLEEGGTNLSGPQKLNKRSDHIGPMPEALTCGEFP